MKIVAIMGSPHKGNSLEFTQRIEAHLKAMGDVDFEYIHLKDVDLKPCKGCFVCFMKGESRCPIQDDKAAIAQSIEEADGVIFVSPVYGMHVSYLMKQFIDRFGYVFHRPRYFGKYALVVAVAGNIGINETLKYLDGVAGAWGFDVVDKLGYRAVPKHTTLRVLDKNEDRSKEAARKLYTAIKEQLPRRLTFMDHLGFRLMQAAYKRLETMSPTDYQHWKEHGFLKKDARYFHDNVKINPLMDLVARFAGWMTGRQIDSALKTS